LRGLRERQSRRAALRPNTKLISINFPNNPTGKIIPRAVFDAIVDICRSRGIWLFSDEVYRLIERDPALRLPQAVDVSDARMFRKASWRCAIGSI
jgi:aspartate/methionine/tyrosine aminotransferase